MPATPTSYNCSTGLPNARAVTAASSATGMSLVPAVAINTGPYVLVVIGSLPER
jgi:hypothetical protein